MKMLKKICFILFSLILINNTVLANETSEISCRATGETYYKVGGNSKYEGSLDFDFIIDDTEGVLYFITNGAFEKLIGNTEIFNSRNIVLSNVVLKDSFWDGGNASITINRHSGAFRLDYDRYNFWSGASKTVYKGDCFSARRQRF